MRLCEVSRRLAQAARDEGESALLKALCDLEVEASPDGVRLEKDAGALHVSAQDARERHVVRVTHVAQFESRYITYTTRLTFCNSQTKRHTYAQGGERQRLSSALSREAVGGDQPRCSVSSMNDQATPEPSRRHSIAG